MRRVMWTTIGALLLAAPAIAQPLDNGLHAARDRSDEFQAPRHDRSDEAQAPRGVDEAPTPR